MGDVTDRLRTIADAATPGPWGWDAIGYSDDDVRVQVVQGMWDLATINDDPPPEIRDGTVEERKATARHIATFDPRLVAAMLDIIDAAERVNSGTPVDPHVHLTALGDMHAALARFREVAGE